MMKTLRYLFCTLAFCLVMSPATVTVAQYSYQGANPGGLAKGTNLNELIINIVKWILGFTAALAILMIIFGGIMYIVSSGDSGRIDTAKNIVIYAIAGLVVVLLSYAIVASISRGLGAGGA